MLIMIKANIMISQLIRTQLSGELTIIRTNQAIQAIPARMLATLFRVNIQTAKKMPPRIQIPKGIVSGIINPP
jgi:hypothetical protein